LEDVLENGSQEALVSDIDKVAKHLHAKSRMSHPTFWAVRWSCIGVVDVGLLT
jgi:hypothetical protein